MIVVRAVDVDGVPAVAPIARELVGERRLKVRGFLVGEDVFLAVRPLERRAGGVIPHALEIGIAPRGLRRAVASVRLKPDATRGLTAERDGQRDGNGDG